ncbi:MAG TPA: cell division protein FtsA [Prolixibacteraceae bacterium]|nr:cell division protein FtsA [Prolixibacteraceae bacterium]
MASTNNLSVVFDIGTSKIIALAGEKTEDGKPEVLGVANVLAKGIKRGVVFNIEEAAASIEIALAGLEEETGETIKKADVAFASQHMKAVDYTGFRNTTGDGIVSNTDIDELYNEALNLKVQQDYKILHVIPQQFIIDEENISQNPVGITGRKIEARYKLIVVPEAQLTNIYRVFEKAGIEIKSIWHSALALTEVILTEEEKEVGAIVLDIGAGTTKMATYLDGAMVHTSVIPFGGNVITADIKEGCSIHLKWAEQLKVQYGQALGDFADEQKVVTIPGHNGWEPKEISFKSLAFIIQARLEEIMDSVNYQIEKSGVDGKLGSGIIVTGGTSNLNNFVSLVKFRTGFDARNAFSVYHPVNRQKELKSQEYFTALGLLKTVLDKSTGSVKPKKKKKKKEGGFSPWFKNVVQGVLDYVDDDEGTELN